MFIDTPIVAGRPSRQPCICPYVSHACVQPFLFKLAPPWGVGFRSRIATMSDLAELDPGYAALAAMVEAGGGEDPPEPAPSRPRWERGSATLMAYARSQWQVQRAVKKAEEVQAKLTNLQTRPPRVRSGGGLLDDWAFFANGNPSLGLWRHPQGMGRRHDLGQKFTLFEHAWRTLGVSDISWVVGSGVRRFSMSGIIAMLRLRGGRQPEKSFRGVPSGARFGETSGLAILVGARGPDGLGAIPRTARMWDPTSWAIAGVCVHE